jgi:hypothetical protein
MESYRWEAPHGPTKTGPATAITLAQLALTSTPGLRVGAGRGGDYGALQSLRTTEPYRALHY